ncbi:MAG: pantetheine-phosphate adenylyltransferase [Candidatus Omnitrophota bacterium]
MSLAVYPGSFDPVTNGHLDLIKRALQIFDRVIVAIARNVEKNPLFTPEERLDMMREATRNLKRVEVDAFDGLFVDYVHKKKAHVVIRGLRMISDFEYEFQMALTNRKLNRHVETIFLMPSENYSYLSSRLIKEAAGLGGRVSDFVPPFVEKRLKEKLQFMSHPS